MRDFIFVSGNLKKAEYLERFLGRKVEHHNLDLVEIQSLDPLEVVEHKAKEAYRHLKKPVLIEDTSLTISAFGKLPGPFIKFFLSEMGNEGICRVLNSYEDKTAQASVVYGLFDGAKLHNFSAKVEGQIPAEPQVGRGMGWDPIFIPAGQSKTYAEMNEQEYDQYSVRNKAVQELAAFLKSGKYWGEL